PVPTEFQAAVAAGTRTETGQPGPRYWQQRVRYSIEAEVDPRLPRVTGRERVVYHNRSPAALASVKLNLYQNLFSDRFVSNQSPLNTGGLTLTRVVVQGQPLGEVAAAELQANQREGRTVPGYSVSGTLGTVFLPRPIAPGDSAVFEIDWNFRVPPRSAPRTGFEDALGGRVLQVAQWYPQIAVHDDLVGQDVTPYTGNGEFYLEYGDFDVTLTLPSGWVVGATGTLQNSEQVLPAPVRQRLEAALRTDSVVHVVTREDLDGKRATLGGDRLTWRFQARDVRDFAFALSDRYLWDATRAVIPAEGGGTRTVPVHSLYRPGAPGWEQGARYGQHSLVHLSRVIIPYLYPQLTVSEGPIYGMEYPMLIFIGRPDDAEGLYEVIAHEVGHEWFPMMVGQDEAAYGWMDEGFTTYHEAVAFQDFFPRSDHWEEPRSLYLQIAGQKVEAPMMRHIDLVGEGLASGVSAYFKPGTLLRSLRTAVGAETFDQAMRTYAREWLLKHPTPWDFFNTVERVAGRDLDWFWNPWFFQTATLDQAIESVTPGAGTVRVTVRDVGQAPAPSIVTVTTRDGQQVSQTIAIDSWIRPNRRVATVDVAVPGPVAKVEIDPEMLFPDVNRRNNVWTP
ncbi:MAG TPA: M1 family metallopeptidase, partial [Longimicrobiaceae bacterium]|nr:M1 family metallopeptidase [Longimicrobiaceae bacterium]